MSRLYHSLLILTLGVQSKHSVILGGLLFAMQFAQIALIVTEKAALRICLSKASFRRIVHYLDTHLGSIWLSLQSLMFFTFLPRLMLFSTEALPCNVGDSRVKTLPLFADIDVRCPKYTFSLLSGLLFAMLFSQIALIVTEKAVFEDMLVKGFVQ